MQPARAFDMLIVQMATRPVLMSCIAFSTLACATANHPAGGPFESVGLETGGFCQTQAACWTRIVADASGGIAVERPDNFRVADRIAGADLEGVRAIVDDPTFRRDIAASTPACPPVADFEATIVLTATDGGHTDKQAAGCLVSDEFRDHPYRRLRTLLEGMVAAHFPDVKLQ